MSTAIKHGANNILYSPTIERPIWNRDGEKIGVETISAHTNRLTILEPSLYRRITALFWTVTNNMWVSLGSLIGASLGVRLKNEDTDQVDAAPQMTGIPINSAINRLRSQTKLGTAAIDEYCQYLAQEHNAQYIPNCVIDLTLKDVATFPEATHQNLIIPVVLKGWPIDHIVSIYITRNKDEATIEFYDSKGLTIGDRLNHPLANSAQMTLGRLVAELADRYCSDLTEDQITVKENTTKHQWDSHNCGVYVCRYFDARLRGTDTSAIYAEQINYNHTFAWRTEIIHDLMPTFKAKVKERAALNVQDFEEFDMQDIPEDPNEDFLQHPIFDEVNRFNQGGIVLPDDDDEETEVIEKQPAPSSYRQIGESIGLRTAKIYTDLVDVSLKE